MRIRWNIGLLFAVFMLASRVAGDVSLREGLPRMIELVDKQKFELDLNLVFNLDQASAGLKFDANVGDVHTRDTVYQQTKSTAQFPATFCKRWEVKYSDPPNTSINHLTCLLPNKGLLVQFLKPDGLSLDGPDQLIPQTFDNMECTSIAKLNNFDGKNNVKLFISCHTGDKETPQKTGIWTYSSDTNTFSPKPVYIEQTDPDKSFVATFNLDVRVVSLGSPAKNYLLILNRAWKPDQTAEYFVLVEIDATTSELVAESVKTYSFAFSDGSTIVSNIQNAFDFNGSLVVVGMLTSDVTQPISMMMCPLGSSQSKNDVTILTCNADVPQKNNKKQSRSKNDDPVQIQTFNTSYGAIEIVDDIDTPTVLVLDSTVSTKNDYTLNSATYYTLGTDFTDPSWITQGNQFTTMPDTFDPNIFNSDSSVISFDIDRSNMNYAVMNFKEKSKFGGSLILSQSLPAQVRADQFSFIANKIGSIFSISSAKVEYFQYRDWSPNFLLIDTGLIDPKKTSQLTLTASETDSGQSVTSTSSIALKVSSKLVSSISLSLKDKQKFEKNYLMNLAIGSRAAFGFEDVQTGVDVQMSAEPYVPVPSSSSSASSASAQVLQNQNDQIFSYVSSRVRKFGKISGISETANLNSVISVGTGVVYADDSDKKSYFSRCRHDTYTNIDLTCDPGSKAEVILTTDDVLAPRSKTLDSITLFFTKSASTTTSKFYLDTGYGSLVTLEVQDLLDPLNLLLFRDNSGLFYGLATNQNADTVYGFAYDHIAMAISALDPINAATFGIATDFCIKSISSNNDPYFLEVALLSKCESDVSSNVFAMGVNSSGATLNRQIELDSPTIDKICTAAGNKYLLWDRSAGSLKLIENHISIYQNSFNLELYDTDGLDVKNLECLGEMNHFLLSVQDKAKNQYQILKVQSNMLFSLNKSYVKIYGFQDLYGENSQHVNFGIEDIYVSGKISDNQSQVRLHHGWSLSAYLICQACTDSSQESQIFSYWQAQAQAQKITQATTTLTNAWEHDMFNVTSVADAEQISENLFNLEQGLKIQGGLTTYKILNDQGQEITDKDGLKLLPRIRLIYQTYPQQFRYINVAISRDQATITPGTNVMIGFLATGIMVYQLPSNKPISPSPIDLGTRVLPVPSAAVTEFGNPSTQNPNYFACHLQMKYGSSIKTLNCFITDGTTTNSFQWDDQQQERNWTELQLERGLDSKSFYVVGSGAGQVEVLRLVLDTDNFIIKIDRSEFLTNCQFPAALSSNYANVYVYCIQFQQNNFQVNGFEYPKYQFKRRDLAPTTFTKDFSSYGQILDMRVATVDDNHFQITANTDSQILFSILLDKDYPGRIKRINLRKFYTWDGVEVDNFGSLTALKVRDVREDTGAKIVIWDTSVATSESSYLEIYGLIEDSVLPEQGTAFRFSTSTMTNLPVLAVINQGVINIYEVGELQLKITKMPSSSSSSSPVTLLKGSVKNSSSTSAQAYDDSNIFKMLEGFQLVLGDIAGQQTMDLQKTVFYSKFIVIDKSPVLFILILAALLLTSMCYSLMNTVCKSQSKLEELKGIDRESNIRFNSIGIEQIPEQPDEDQYSAVQFSLERRGSVQKDQTEIQS